MKPLPFKLERYFAKHEFTAKYLLCSSDPESLSIEELLNYEPDSFEKFRKHRLGYTEAKGNPELRSEVAKLYENITSDEVLVHAGAEEVIFIFSNVVLGPGDHAIVHFPCYQSLFEVARATGADITKWETKEENNWELDIDFLKKNIRKNTKAIIFNCPHNPTGYLMKKEKLQEILNIAKENNIYILSDEVYRFLEYDEKNRLPAACDLYKNAVSIGVMSKAFSLPGLRIGWAATKNKRLLEEMSAFKDYTTICSSAPSEFLAIVGLRHRGKILKRNFEIILNNLKILNTFFKKHEDTFYWKTPMAGTIAFPRIKLDVNIEDFCNELIKEKSLMLLPGTQYDYGDKHFRIGFGRKNMPECLGKLEEHLSLSKCSLS